MRMHSHTKRQTNTQISKHTNTNTRVLSSWCFLSGARVHWALGGSWLAPHLQNCSMRFAAFSLVRLLAHNELHHSRCQSHRAQDNNVTHSHFMDVFA